MDWSGCISKCGDRSLRSLLFEAATTLIDRARKLWVLKGWAIRSAGRLGFAKVVVTTACKLSVHMLTLWKTDLN